MTMPSPDELEQALNTAKLMREQDNDQHFLAKSLLNHDYRLKKLDAVLEAVGHYFHSGNAPLEHQALIKAMDEAKKAEYIPGRKRFKDTDVVI